MYYKGLKKTPPHLAKKQVKFFSPWHGGLTSPNKKKKHWKFKKALFWGGHFILRGYLKGFKKGLFYSRLLIIQKKKHFQN